MKNFNINFSGLEVAGFYHHVLNLSYNCPKIPQLQYNFISMLQQLYVYEEMGKNMLSHYVYKWLTFAFDFLLLLHVYLLDMYLLKRKRPLHWYLLMWHLFTFNCKFMLQNLLINVCMLLLQNDLPSISFTYFSWLETLLAKSWISCWYNT